MPERHTNKNIETIYYSTPLCDIYEETGFINITCDLPGVEKDDIDLTIEKDILTIKADCKAEPEKSYKCLKKEMDYTGYKRSFVLNDSVMAEEIEADYTDGVLYLTIPKKDEYNATKINIKVK